MNCFDSAPEFIDEDNRRFRVWNPVSKEQMIAKHGALLPGDLVQGKSILDLGCCLGATGYWCLSHGASHYTGVEVQREYAQSAQRLLARYHPGRFAIHQMAIEKWLAQPGLESYDIVCLLGVIFAFTDYFSVLKHSAAIARTIVAIEGLHAVKDPDFCGVKFLDDQPINLAGAEASVVGRGTRISPKGMAWLMEELGFKSKEGVIFPPPITDVPDIYNREPGTGLSVRFLMRFERVPATAHSLSEDLQSGAGRIKSWKA